MKNLNVAILLVLVLGTQALAQTRTQVGEIISRTNKSPYFIKFTRSGDDKTPLDSYELCDSTGLLSQPQPVFPCSKIGSERFYDYHKLEANLVRVQQSQQSAATTDKVMSYGGGAIGGFVGFVYSIQKHAGGNAFLPGLFWTAVGTMGGIVSGKLGAGAVNQITGDDARKIDQINSAEMAEILNGTRETPDDIVGFAQSLGQELDALNSMPTP